jgi:dihydroorotate dehydrogenase (fumarate)
MLGLSTSYMGLQLQNPIVVGSCTLTDNPKRIKRCADAGAGAGAVVLKSLFEEQIRHETEGLEKYLWPAGHPEALSYIRKMGMEVGPHNYLELIKKSKQLVSIPVIASLNCVSSEWWMDYAVQIEAAGADGLEVNVAIMSSNPDSKSTEIEDRYFNIIEGLKAHISIPISMKIHPYFTSMGRMAKQLSERGASALVLFNRFYQLDIDVEKLELAAGKRFSTPQEIYPSLRWIMLLAGRLSCDLAASTGVHDGQGVIKQLLAGATVVQICSTLYLNGLTQIGHIVDYMKDWMGRHGFDSIHQMRGKMSQMKSEHPDSYERLQYIKALTGIG